MTFGKRLKQLREEKQWDRYQLARRIDASYSTVAKYESDARFPDQITLRKLADIFNVSIDYLMGRTNNRRVNNGDPDDIDLDKLDETDLTIAAMRPDMLEGYQDLEPEAKELLRDIIRNFYKRFGKKES